MKSNRCKQMVIDELNKLEIGFVRIDLGEVVLDDNTSEEKLQRLDNALNRIGIGLINDRETNLVNQIKSAIKVWMEEKDELFKPTYSTYIKRNIPYDYTYLSNIFSSSEGITIEKYIILKRIEKVKELLVTKAMSLSDIAFNLNYSSLAHLSTQFKKFTGETPSSFSSNSNSLH